MRTCICTTGSGRRVLRRRRGAPTRPPEDTAGVLLLAECQGVDAFSHLADGSPSSAPWRFKPARDALAAVLAAGALAVLP